MSNSTYTISARGKTADQFIEFFLHDYFNNIPFAYIESVFGFVESCKLYGGRTYRGPELSDLDIHWLAMNNIGIRLPLTSLYYTLESYDESKFILEKYHNTFNTIICTSDELAVRISDDFPYYTLEASVIKNIDTQEKITEALELYDTVILPTKYGTELDVLGAFEPKNRLRVFTAGGCGYNCPAKVCYSYVSKLNAGQVPTEPGCSKVAINRRILGMVNFNVEAIQALGYTKFKAVRSAGKNTLTY